MENMNQALLASMSILFNEMLARVIEENKDPEFAAYALRNYSKLFKMCVITQKLETIEFIYKGFKSHPEEKDCTCNRCKKSRGELAPNNRGFSE